MPTAKRRVSIHILAAVAVVLTACGCAQAPSGKQHAGRRDETSEAPGLGPAVDLQKKTARLLRQLASSKYKEREDAQDQLQKLLDTKSGAILSSLQETRKTTRDPEVKQRLERLLQPYLKWRITPAVLDAIPNIIELLEKNSRSSMRTAVEGLRKLDIQHTRGVLFTVINQSKHGNRRTLEALVEQADSKVVEFFTDHLIRECEEGRSWWTIEHILKRISEKSIPSMKKLLHETQNNHALHAAANVLAAAGEEGRKVLVDALQIGQPSLKVAVMWAFHGHPKIALLADMLFKLIKHEDNKVRSVAARLLVSTGHEKALETLISVLASDKDAMVRARAIVALMATTDRRVIPALVKALKDPDGNVRHWAAKALRQSGDKRIIKSLPLVPKLDGPEEPKVDLALQRLGDEVVEKLTGMLKTVEPWRRKLVVRALRFTGSRLALPVFLKILADKKEEVSARVEAALSLASFNEKKVVRALIDALEDHNSSVRAQSACSLGLLADRQAVEPLIKILKDTDETVRACAAQALRNIGDKRAVELLTNALEDSSSRVRFHAIRALAEIGGESAFEPLLKLRKEEKTNCYAFPKALARTGGKKAIPHLIGLFDSILDSEACDEIIRFGEDAVAPLLEVAKSDRAGAKAWALKALAMLREEKALDLTLKALGDESSRVREAAAEALALYKDARAVEPLIQLLRDGSAGVRLQAAYSLGHLRDKQAVKPLISILLDDESEGPRKTAAYALAKIGDKTAIEPLIAVLLDEKMEGFSSTFEDFRCAAARALGSFKEARVVEALIKRLEDEKDDIASAAMHALGEIGDRRAAPPLMKMGPVDRTAAVLRKLRAPESVDFFLSVLEKNKHFLMSERWGAWRRGPFDISFDDVIDCRMSAIYALSEIGDKRAVEPLERLLASRSTCVCMAAATALLRFGHKHAAGILKKAIESDNVDQQKEALDALLESPHPQAIPWLTEALTKRDTVVRNWAATALGKLGDRRASDALTGALADKNMFVRSTAAEALGELKEERAVEQLVKLLSSDPDLGVRESALDALGEVTGQNFGWNYQRWRRWLKERERQEPEPSRK